MGRHTDGDGQARTSIRRQLLVLVFLLSALPGVALGQGSRYTISRYAAEFTPVPGRDGRLTDVRVRMEVTYDIVAGPKADGFKYVGIRPVRDVSVTDVTGTPLPFHLNKEREYRIAWQFPSVDRGYQTVVAEFTVASAVAENGEAREIRFDWVAHWKVPVFDVTYRFRLPPLAGLTVVQSDPSGGRLQEEDDGPVFSIRMHRLGGDGVRLRFSADRFRTERSLLKTVLLPFAWVFEAAGDLLAPDPGCPLANAESPV